MKKIYLVFIALFLMNISIAQWFQQNSGTTKNLNSIYFTDVNTGYAVGDSGIILKTTNGGTDWTTQTSGIINELRSVCFPDNNTGFAVGYRTEGTFKGAVLKTSDGGSNWTFVQLPEESLAYSSVFFVDSTTGYILGLGGEIYKTTNGGTTWSYSHLPISFNLFVFSSLFFIDADTGFIVGDDLAFRGNECAILKTTDGGANWTAFEYYEAITLSSVFFSGSSTGYVVGTNWSSPGEMIFKTSNGGNDWTQQNADTYDISLNSIFFTAPDTGYLVGGGIIRTVDGGVHWTNQTPEGITLLYLNSVFFADAGIGYSAGDFGTILKTTNGGLGITGHTNAATLLKIYPNPSVDKITISSATTGSLSVHNPGGQQLMQLEIKDPKATVDVSSLPSGIYLVELIGEKAVQVGKFIKQ